MNDKIEGPTLRQAVLLSCSQDLSVASLCAIIVRSNSVERHWVKFFIASRPYSPGKCGTKTGPAKCVIAERTLLDNFHLWLWLDVDSRGEGGRKKADHDFLQLASFKIDHSPR